MAKEQHKHVYKVTFYYHSNCDVLITSDVPLSREEAIDKAYSEVNRPRYKQQIIEGLQEVDTPDCTEEKADTDAFDKNGRIIHAGDKIMYYSRTLDCLDAGTVKTIAVTPKKATITIANQYRCVNVPSKDCVVYE